MPGGSRAGQDSTDAKQVGILLDAGPEKLLWLLDKFLAEEAAQ